MVDVLVVDPGELGELLSTLFEQYGMSAVCARTGEHALELALKERPGVVVVEYELPDVNGLEVADLVRAELDAKVILTYALARANDAGNEDFERRLAKLDATFSRPFRSLTLIQKASELLGNDVESPAVEDTQVGAPRPASDDVVLLLDQVVEDEIGYDLEEDIVLDVDVADLDMDVANVDVDVAELQGPEESFTYRARPVDDRVAVGSAPASEPAGAAEAAREGVTLSLGPGWEVSHSDITDVHALWARLRDAKEAEPTHRREEPAKSPTTRSGRLTPKVLAELLDAFHQSQTTGEIWLNHDRARRVLLVARGVIVGARSNLAPEDLAAVAKKRGLLSDAQIAEARADVRAKDARTFGEAVRRRGFLDERAFLRLLDEQVRRIVLGAFTWHEGTFEVTLEGRGKNLPVQVHMTAGDAIVRGVVLTESLEALREAAPDDARFAPNPGAAFGLEDVTLTADEARLVIAMDGTKTVKDLSTLFPELPERLIRGLGAGLFRLGVVRFAGRGPAEARRISFF